MEQALEFIVRHGYSIIFALVLAEQLGLPLPALPILLGMGALTADGSYSLVIALVVAVLASLAADLFWFRLGRSRGHSILRLLCRISLEPDSCVRSTEEIFARHGAWALLYAKFVPAINTATPPLAGMFGLPLWRFLIYDGLGAVLWAGIFLSLGRLFSDQLLALLAMAEGAATATGIAAAALFSLYLAIKYRQRRRFLRDLRIARITPEELASRLEAGEEVVVVDLRHAVDFGAERLTIPGALRLSPEEIESRHVEIPRQREIVLFCT